MLCFTRPFLIWLSLPSLSFENEASLEFSFEIEHIDERKLDEKFVDRDIINSLLSSNLPSSDKNSFLLLFISEANSFGNCLNEVNDYIEISKKINSKLDFYTALIYHSEDSLQAKRFSNASNFESVSGVIQLFCGSNSALYVAPCGLLIRLSFTDNEAILFEPTKS